MGKVEERLWSIIRNFANLGRDHPAVLVNAVRIIELQELVDRSLESSAGGRCPFQTIMPAAHRDSSALPRFLKAVHSHREQENIALTRLHGAGSASDCRPMLVKCLSPHHRRPRCLPKRVPLQGVIESLAFSAQGQWGRCSRSGTGSAASSRSA